MLVGVAMTGDVATSEPSLVTKQCTSILTSLSSPPSSAQILMGHPELGFALLQSILDRSDGVYFKKYDLDLY